MLPPYPIVASSEIFTVVDGMGVPSLNHLVNAPYLEGDEIVIAFEYPGNPGLGAWISLWPADSDPNSLPSPAPYWNYICSDTQSNSCVAHPTAGTVTLNADSEGSGTWPISCGSWKAYLIEEATNYPYYTSIAQTDAFEVGSGGSCPNPVCNVAPEDPNPDNTHVVSCLSYIVCSFVSHSQYFS